MKKILFATGNETKAKRFSKGLLKHDTEVVTLKDIDIKIDVEENGKDAIENALIKARAYSKETKLPVFAMDDNLYIDGIPNSLQPGMYVRRVNGKKLTDEEMITHYSSLVKKYGTNGKLTARWVYGIALIVNGVESTYTWTKKDFYLVDMPSEKVDVGYPLNSISVDIVLNKYFTEMTEEDKENSIENENHVIDFLVNHI